MAQIYVACLASYNNGRHHGEWFDLEDYTDADDLQADIKEKVLITSPCPNVFVECPCCEGKGKVHVPVNLDGSVVEVEHTCSQCNGNGKVSSSEEFAVHDYDDDSGLFRQFGEYPNLEELIEQQRMLEKHGDAWAAFVGRFGTSVTEQDFEDSYCGEYESLEDYVQQFCEDIYGWKGGEPFYNWIDWERAARDFSGDFTYADGYVFRDSW